MVTKNSLICQTAKIFFYCRLLRSHFEALFEHETAIDFQKLYSLKGLFAGNSFHYFIPRNLSKFWKKGLKTKKSENFRILVFWGPFDNLIEHGTAIEFQKVDTFHPFFAVECFHSANIQF